MAEPSPSLSSSKSATIILELMASTSWATSTLFLSGPSPAQRLAGVEPPALKGPAGGLGKGEASAIEKGSGESAGSGPVGVALESAGLESGELAGCEGLARDASRELEVLLSPKAAEGVDTVAALGGAPAVTGLTKPCAICAAKPLELKASSTQVLPLLRISLSLPLSLEATSRAYSSEVLRGGSLEVVIKLKSTIMIINNMKPQTINFFGGKPWGGSTTGLKSSSAPFTSALQTKTTRVHSLW